MIIDAWRLQRRWRRFQRPVAVVLVGAGALLLLADRSAPVATQPTAVATVELGVGQVVQPSDVQVVEWPTSHRPAGATATTDELIGRHTTTAISAGEPLTPARVVGPAAVAALGSGLAAVPLPEDPLTSAGLVRPGDRVDIVGQSQAGPRTLVRSATVLTVAAGAGPIVAVPATTAPQVVQAAATDSVGVVLVGH